MNAPRRRRIPTRRSSRPRPKTAIIAAAADRKLNKLNSPQGNKP